MAEAERLVLEAIDSIAQKHASHTEPNNSLSDTLALKSAAKLKELARAYRIKGYTKMGSTPLISAISRAMVDSGRLEALLCILEAPEWKAFEQAAGAERLACDGVLCAHLDLLQSLGYVQTYFFDENLFAVVPMEIREAFQSLLKVGFRTRKERSDLLHTYATAAINLYGIISQDEFVAIFNAQNQQATDNDEVYQTLMKRVMVRSDYCFWDEYIVSDSFEEDEFEGAEALLRLTEGKPRYIPAPKEFALYFDAAYYEHTKETHALVQYLNTVVADADDAQAIVDDICFECSMECSLDDIFKLLDNNNVVFETVKQAEQFASLLMNVKNNSRIWANKGHTPNEMAMQFRGQKLVPFPALAKSEKIGRNDPCPCGSGKKYKKCCGR